MVENTEYSLKTQKALSNYFEGLTEPVSLFIGTYDPNRGSNKDSSRDGDNALIIKTVEILRKNGIDAVPFFDESAKSPDKVIVSKTGLQTPFVAPEKAKEEAANLLSILENNGLESLGFVTPNTEKQLLYPAINDDIMDANKIINIEKANPDLEKFQQIMKENGASFINDMLDNALNSSDLKSLGGDITAEMDKENQLHGSKTLYKGATQGANVFAVISPFEARNVPHASPKLTIAKGYSGLGINASSKGGATYVDKESERSYGFIYEIEALDDQKYYANVGLETASEELKNSEQYFETPVMPHRNKVKAVYLHCGTKTEDFLFKIPENDPRWQDFMALHEPSDNTIFGYLADRRKQQKDDAKAAGHTIAYEFNKHQELDIPDYRDLSEVKTINLLKSIAKKVDVHEDENGILIVNGDVDLSNLDIKKLPNDFSKIKINGLLKLSGNDQLEISSLDQLPETTKGVVSYSGANLSFGDLSQTSSEEMIAKLCGTQALQKDEEGFYPELDFSGNIDKLPDDFKNIKAKAIDFGGYVEFDTIHDIPETANGVLRNLNIKDQDFDISPHYFLEKTKGNRYMGSVLGTNSQNKVDNFVPEQLGFMNFSGSNIHHFPKGMENITFDALMVNPDHVFDSLDNFPKTRRGVSGLELTGISEQETAKSFLEKVWGTERLVSESHMSENGDIVIHNDLDLGNNRTVNIAPDAIPRDFATVKIGGSMTLDSHLSGAYRIAEDRRPSVEFLKNDKQIDLSGYKDKIVFNIRDLQQAEQVVMPKEVEDILLQGNKLPEITLDCSGAKNLKISYDSDLSAAAIIMPQKANNIIIEDSTLSVGPLSIDNAHSLEMNRVTLDKTDLSISQTKYVSLNNITLNENSALDCQESAALHMHNCDLSNIKDFKLPDSPDSNINFYRTKLPKGEYDFAKYEKTFGLNTVEFTPDSKVNLPQMELTPNQYFGGYTVKAPEVYAYSVDYPGVKFPEMEWELFKLKASNPEDKNSAEFQEFKEYYEKTAFANKQINLMEADLSLVKNFNLPEKMSVLKLDRAIMPECSLDLSGADYLTISNTDFRKCDEIKFPEKINDLGIHQNKFKDGAQIDVSGAQKLSIHAQDFSNVSGLKINPEGELTISMSNLPKGIDLDLSKCKSIQISESDLSQCKTLRLPEGYSLQNIINSQLPENVFIGEERYIAPKEEKIQDVLQAEEKAPSVKEIVPEVSEPQPIQAEPLPPTMKQAKEAEPKTYKLSDIQNDFKWDKKKFNDPDGIVIDDRKRIKNKELKSLGLSKPQRRSLILNRRKEKVGQFLGKIKDLAKNNKLASEILNLRGVKTKPTAHTINDDKINVVDFTEKKEIEISSVGDEKSKSPNGAKVPTSVKRAINAIRGIIQPKKKQTPVTDNNAQDKTITSTAIAKEMSSKREH